MKLIRTFLLLVIVLLSISAFTQTQSQFIDAARRTNGVNKEEVLHDGLIKYPKNKELLYLASEYYYSIKNYSETIIYLKPLLESSSEFEREIISKKFIKANLNKKNEVFQKIQRGKFDSENYNNVLSLLNEETSLEEDEKMNLYQIKLEYEYLKSSSLSEKIKVASVWQRCKKKDSNVAFLVNPVTDLSYIAEVELRTFDYGFHSTTYTTKKKTQYSIEKDFWGDTYVQEYTTGGNSYSKVVSYSILAGAINKSKYELELKLHTSCYTHPWGPGVIYAKQRTDNFTSGSKTVNLKPNESCKLELYGSTNGSSSINVNISLIANFEGTKYSVWLASERAAPAPNK